MLSTEAVEQYLLHRMARADLQQYPPKQMPSLPAKGERNIIMLSARHNKPA